MIQPLLLLRDQSFLESHLVLGVEHVTLHLKAIVLVFVFAQLLVLFLELLDPCALHCIELSGLFLEVFSSKVVQDLLLELQALMTDKSLLL